MSDFYDEEPKSSLLKIGKRQLTESSNSGEDNKFKPLKRISSTDVGLNESDEKKQFASMLEPKSGILRKRKISSDSDSDYFNIRKNSDLAIANQEYESPRNFMAAAKREFKFFELIGESKVSDFNNQTPPFLTDFPHNL
jgi:hypothetical protein